MYSERNKKSLEFFVYNVSWLRNHYGIKKKTMAELLGIGVGSLNKIEKGELPPRLTVEIIFNIQNYFGIHPKELFERKLGI